jgi:hypothetical protein
VMIRLGLPAGTRPRKLASASNTHTHRPAGRALDQSKTPSKPSAASRRRPPETPATARDHVADRAKYEHVIGRPIRVVVFRPRTLLAATRSLAAVAA